MTYKKTSDFADLRKQLAEGDPPENMPIEVSKKLEKAGMELAKQRLYLSPNPKGSVDWIEHPDGTLVIRMTPFRADVVLSRFQHVFEKAFGAGKCKIIGTN